MLLSSELPAQMWVDECAKLAGGLDICAVDALHSKADGKEYILVLAAFVCLHGLCVLCSSPVA